jgi:hypothetical protein
MSTIAAQCTNCGRKGNVPEQVLGRQVKCPGCGATFTVTAPDDNKAAAATPPPAGTSTSKTGGAWFVQKADGKADTPAPATPPPTTESFLTAQCPCGFSGRVPERFRGKQVKCRQCGQMFSVPDEAAAPKESKAPIRADKPASTDEIGLAPLEEEKTAETVVAAGETECEVIEDVEVVADVACPVCGHELKLPKGFQGKKGRCPKCCTVFNVDGAPDDSAAEPGSGPKKAGDSQTGAGQRPEPETGEQVQAAPSPWSSLDQPEPRQKKKRPPATEESEAAAEAPRLAAFKRKQPEDEVAQRQSALMVVGASTGALVLLAGAFALVSMVIKGDNTPPVAQARSEPVAPRPPSVTKAKAPPVSSRPVISKQPDPPEMRDPPPEKKDPPPDPPEKLIPMPKEGEWVDVSERSCRFGNIRLRVTTVWIDDVKMMLRGEKAGVAEDVLVIQYEVENIADKGVISFFGWGAQNAKPGEPVAVLTDNNGRLYRRLLLEAVDGQVEAKLLDPGKRTSDRLLFASPDEKAEFFRVELPAKNFNGEGTVRLQIPKSMIMPKVVRKDTDPAPKEENKKLKALRAQLKSRLAPERIRACDGIGSLRDEGAPAVPDLIKLYTTERDDNVKAAICEALQFIGPTARAAVPTLLKALKDEFWRVRRNAAVALGIIGADADQTKQAVPLLTEMLKSKDEGVADAARNALRRLQPKGK